MPDQTIDLGKRFGAIYRDIAATIESASKDLSALTLDHEEGRQRQSELLTELQVETERFGRELALLERHAEWEQLTVAFFGETNAGKSTIIESLRILLNEEGRQAELETAGRDLEAYEQRLQAQASRLSSAVEAVEREQSSAQERFREAQSQQQQAFEHKLRRAIADFEAGQQRQALALATQIHDVHGFARQESSDRTRRRVQVARGMGLAVGGLIGSLLGHFLPF